MKVISLFMEHELDSSRLHARDRCLRIILREYKFRLFRDVMANLRSNEVLELRNILKGSE